jgi:hypothetical protein
MKSTIITFDRDALLQWCLTGSLDLGFICNPKNFGERWITLEGEVCFTQVNMCLGSARIDWYRFSNVILASRTRPQLVVEGGFFTFRIPTPLKDYADGMRSMVHGTCSSELSRLFSEVPFSDLRVSQAIEA